MNENSAAKFNLLHGSFKEYLKKNVDLESIANALQDSIYSMYGHQVFEFVVEFNVLEGWLPVDNPKGDEVLYENPDTKEIHEYGWDTWNDLWFELRDEFVDDLVEDFIEIIKDKLDEEYNFLIEENKNILYEKANELPDEWEY